MKNMSEFSFHVGFFLTMSTCPSPPDIDTPPSPPDIDSCESPPSLEFADDPPLVRPNAPSRSSAGPFQAQNVKDSNMLKTLSISFCFVSAFIFVSMEYFRFFLYYGSRGGVGLVGSIFCVLLILGQFNFVKMPLSRMLAALALFSTLYALLYEFNFLTFSLCICSLLSWVTLKAPIWMNLILLFFQKHKNE